MKNFVIAVIIALCVAGTGLELSAQSVPYPIQPIDMKRVKEIEQYLNDAPAGFGDPCINRKVWDRLLLSGQYNSFLRSMPSYKMPAFSKEDYFSLSKGTESSSGKGLTMMRKRAEGLSKLTWAECLENKNRYTKRIELALRDLIQQKSWTSPRSDHGFKNYNGIAYSVELTSSLYAHTIAQTLYLMGDKVPPDLRKLALDALYTRIFNPVMESFKSNNTEKQNGFLTDMNNWNHVCLAGVVGAALTTLHSREERAKFIAIGEYYSGNGLKGFGDDGYCGEGVVYFSYGFGHYILLRESIWQATGGKVDLFKDPKVQKIAAYPANIEVINGVYPAISDCKEGARPDGNVTAYLNKSFRSGSANFDTLGVQARTGDNRMSVMMAFPNSLTKSNLFPGRIQPDQADIRFYFDKTGVLVCRPKPGSSANIGVVFKGGNNAESHNHNDIGSFTIVQGNQIMAGDPGVIPYTANIFDPKYRYTYKTISSFGHPVPLVADSCQQPGAGARSKTIRTAFTPEKDDITLDIASAYPVPGLKKLNRTMVYDRQNKGSVTFTDAFEYAKPGGFETAISTRSEWKQTSGNTLLLTRGNEKMLVTFSSPGNQLLLKSEKIAEGGTPYTRIGISLSKPVTAAEIIITYKPQN